MHATTTAHRLLFLMPFALLGACGRGDGADPAAAAPQAAAVEDARAAPEPAPRAIAPAIIPPDEVADPTEPPSYEVAIASAAAIRNQALGQCAQQPAAVRTQCAQEANAAFADSQADLQRLRGNSP